MGRQINFKIGIIGCGLIGTKRSQALGSKGKLIACADINKILKFFKIGGNY